MQIISARCLCTFNVAAIFFWGGGGGGGGGEGGEAIPTYDVLVGHGCYLTIAQRL